MTQELVDQIARLQGILPWDSAAAFAYLAEIDELTARHGYVTALHGSVMKQGYGRDLDILLVALAPTATEPAEMLRLLAREGEVVRGPDWDGDVGLTRGIYKLGMFESAFFRKGPERPRRVVDVSFRELS